MKQEQLKRGTELARLIQVTGDGLNEMRQLCNRHTILNCGKDYQGKVGFIYNLCVSEGSDGSGMNATMNRYEGNQELVEVIVKELTRQLAAFMDEFDAL